MNPNDYEYLANLLLKKSGLALGPGKEYLLEARLIPLAESWELSGITELVEELRRGLNGQLSTSVVEAMTTNETSFFRDRKPFEDLRECILPQLIEARRSQGQLRMWCAASSTGQEPYSILMTIQESFPELESWKIELLATDISLEALSKAEKGVYSQFEIQRGLPIQYLMKYFEQAPEGWKIQENFRQKVTWRQLNLLDNFQYLGPFDVIFCRNILIYFENQTKKNILDRLSQVLQKDGYLILGAAETVLGISDSFQRHKEGHSAMYRTVSGLPVT